MNLRKQYKSTLWAYFDTTIRQSVTEFQVQPKETATISPHGAPLSAEELGELLVKAVDGLTPAQVDKQL